MGRTLTRAHRVALTTAARVDRAAAGGPSRGAQRTGRVSALACEARGPWLRIMSLPTEETPLEISVRETHRLLTDTPAAVQLIDVREPWEVELVRLAGAETIPMRRIPEALGDLPRDKRILLLCHHGGRSMRVTQWLRAQGLARVSNVAGGIDAWAEEIDPTLRRY